MWEGSGNARTLQWMELFCNPRLMEYEFSIFDGQRSNRDLQGLVQWWQPLLEVALPESESHSGKAGAQERAYGELELVLGAKQYIGKGTEKEGSRRAPQCSSKSMTGCRAWQDHEGRMRCVGSGAAWEHAAFRGQQSSFWHEESSGHTVGTSVAKSNVCWLPLPFTQISTRGWMGENMWGVERKGTMARARWEDTGQKDCGDGDGKEKHTMYLK